MVPNSVNQKTEIIIIQSDLSGFCWLCWIGVDIDQGRVTVSWHEDKCGVADNTFIANHHPLE